MKISFPVRSGWRYGKWFELSRVSKPAELLQQIVNLLRVAMLIHWCSSRRAIWLMVEEHVIGDGCAVPVIIIRRWSSA